MTPFGHDYPPGAEHDPAAPWNESDEEREQIRQQWQEDKADMEKDDQ